MSDGPRRLGRSRAEARADGGDKASTDSELEDIRAARRADNDHVPVVEGDAAATPLATYRLAFDDRAARASAIHQNVPRIVAVDLEVLAAHVQWLVALDEVEIVVGSGSGIAALGDEAAGGSLGPARFPADPIRESCDLPLVGAEGGSGLGGEGHEQRAAMRSGGTEH